VVAPRRGTLRPVPAARGRVPAGGVSAAPPDAGAHVRLVSAIESGPTAATFVSGRPDDGGRLDTVPGRRAAASHDGAPSDGGRLAAGVDQPVARHPSAWRRGRPSSAARHDLLPMPSAEPLPKPSVIERRPHQALEAPPGNGVVRALAGRAGASPPRAAVAVFHHDDAGYRNWLDVHPGGFVLNHARGGRAPTLHRAGCGALEGSRNRAQPVTGRSPKACAPTAEALAAWNAAHGTGAPAPCGRCRP